MTTKRTAEISAVVRSIINRIDPRINVFMRGAQLIVAERDFEAHVDILDSKIKITVTLKDNWSPRRLTD
jgi:hypothetical protein